MRMKNNNNWVNVRRISFLVLCVSLIFPGTVSYADQYSDTRNIIKQWVDTEKEISREQASWAEERALLNDVLSSLNQEERILRETIENAKTDTSRVDVERLELISKRDQYQQNSRSFQENLSLYERQVGQIIPRLPTILKDEIGPLINKLYIIEAGGYSFTERAQNLINIISAIGTFDNSITVASEIRTLTTDEEIEVTVLFLGLSKAFYVDSSKRTAGFGHPIEAASDDGWRWQEQNDLADEILKAINIYENKQSPALVHLPLEIQQN